MSECYVILDREGWEIIGVKGVFEKKQDALKHLEKYRDYVEQNNKSFDAFVNDHLLKTTFTKHLTA